MQATRDRFHTFVGTSFGGVPCAQHWVDFILWEAVLNENPQLRRIVELGTWQGGFSLYLAAQAGARGLDFVTFDVAAPDREIPGFVPLDIYRHRERVLAELRPGPVALFCDGGNKPRELREFTAGLGDDDLVLVHDWGTETQPDDVPPWLREVYGDFCDELGSITRVFQGRLE